MKDMVVGQRCVWVWTDAPLRRRYVQCRCCIVSMAGHGSYDCGDGDGGAQSSRVVEWIMKRTGASLQIAITVQHAGVDTNEEISKFQCELVDTCHVYRLCKATTSFKTQTDTRIHV